MVYYNDNELMIRNMEEADAQVFTDEEVAQGWHTDISKYLTRLRDQDAGKCVSLTAVYKGLPAGYVNVYLTGLGGAFSGKGFPEIVDFGVLGKYRRKGIGSILMDVAEDIARHYMPTRYGLALDSTAGMEMLSECMSNGAISRMGRVFGTGMNRVRNTKRKSQTMMILCFFFLRD